jgi:peptidyl-prolyl cis-trans isomerase B (cyclophilin B)
MANTLNSTYRNLAGSGLIRWLPLAVLVCAFVAHPAVFGQAYAGLEARLVTHSDVVVPGDPIVLDFILKNTTDAPIVLAPLGMHTDGYAAESTLSLPHIFSGPGFTGLTIKGDYGHTWTDVFGYQPPAGAAELHIPANGIVGVTLAINPFYPPVRRAGRYEMVWSPYGGAVHSNRVTIDVEPRKQAVLFTDRGTMKIQFDYERAPKHVENFIDLARDGFYNQRTIHRLEPGYLFQTGCPRGDGTGMRADGKTLDAEFNNTPIDRGTVCMARLESDPNSASCQFFVTATRIPEWDGRYTVFGKLIGEESMATLDTIMSQPVDDDGRPKHRMIVSFVRIVDVPADVRTVEEVPTQMQTVPDQLPTVPAQQSPAQQPTMQSP